MTPTTPSSDSLSLRLRLSLALASPQTVTRRFILQKARHHPACSTGSDSLEAHGFRISFTPLAGVLFTCSLTVLVHYRSSGVFSLGGWSPLLPTGFHVSGGTHGSHARARSPFAYGTLTPSGRPFQQRSARRSVSHSCERSAVPLHGPYNPRSGIAGRPVHAVRFGLLPFRSPLLRESSLFLGVLRCFSSPACLLPLLFTRGHRLSPRPGCPIRISPDQRLPAAPRGISSRGHVLLRLQTPRHPPCARLAVHRSHIPPPPSPGLPQTPSTARPARRSDSIVLAPTQMRRLLGVVLSIASHGAPMRSLVNVHLTPFGDGRWSCGDSNPGPPPCKGGALPTKLQPHRETSAWWAFVDSNHGPQPYQGCALTN